MVTGAKAPGADPIAALPSRPCPACGANGDRDLLFRQRFAAVDDVGLLRGYDVVVCGTCGCGFADRIPPQPHFDAYYAALSKYEYHQRDGEESPYDRARLDLVADDLAPLVPSADARILDVGCATGRLLANLRSRGYGNVVGLDPSPGCAAAARRLYGLEVRTGTLAALPEGLGPVDVIVLVGVLEHLHDVDAALHAVRGLLVDGGVVYVEVPDVLGFADWENAPYQDFSTEHVAFYSPESLATLMARHGFAPLHSVRNAREQSFRTSMANVSAAFRKEAVPVGFTPAFDAGTHPALERYIRDCAEVERRLHARIDALVDSGEPLIVWGVGTHTSRLLATSRLAEGRIGAFVDSNARYQGRELDGIPIVAPETLRGRPEPILVSSRVFEREIERQIRDDLRLPNEVILLYRV